MNEVYLAQRAHDVPVMSNNNSKYKNIVVFRRKLTNGTYAHHITPYIKYEYFKYKFEAGVVHHWFISISELDRYDLRPVSTMSHITCIACIFMLAPIVLPLAETSSVLHPHFSTRLNSLDLWSGKWGRSGARASTIATTVNY